MIRRYNRDALVFEVFAIDEDRHFSRSAWFGDWGEAVDFARWIVEDGNGYGIRYTATVTDHSTVARSPLTVSPSDIGCNGRIHLGRLLAGLPPL